MRVTIELSLYPLREDYTGIIIQLIKDLKAYESIAVHTTAMSTYISGDYEEVFAILCKELKTVYEVIPDSSTVIKIIPKDLNIEKGFLRF
jgi:uncharacterized protein YqgV (UPF0045/DUF77 family)